MDYLYAHVSYIDVVIDTNPGDSLIPGVLIKYEGKFIPSALETVFQHHEQILPYIYKCRSERTVVLSKLCSSMLIPDHVCDETKIRYILINTFGYDLYIRYCWRGDDVSLFNLATCCNCGVKLNIANYNWPHHITPIAECSLYPICEKCYSDDRISTKKTCPKCASVWYEEFCKSGIVCPGCSVPCINCNKCNCDCVKVQDPRCIDCHIVLTAAVCNDINLGVPLYCDHVNRCDSNGSHIDINKCVCYMRCDKCTSFAMHCRICNDIIFGHVDVTDKIQIVDDYIKYDRELTSSCCKIELKEHDELYKIIDQRHKISDEFKHAKSDTRAYVCIQCIDKIFNQKRK